MTSSTVDEKSGFDETCRWYVLAPCFEAHEKITRVFVTTVRRPWGSPNVRVNVCTGEYAPGSVPPPPVGNSARTFQCQMPGPSNLFHDIVVGRIPFASWLPPFG